MDWETWLRQYSREKDALEQTSWREHWRRVRAENAAVFNSLTPENQHKLLQYFGGSAGLTKWQKEQDEKGLDDSIKAAVIVALGEEALPQRFRDVKPIFHNPVMEREWQKQRNYKLFGTPYDPRTGKEVKEMTKAEVDAIYKAREAARARAEAQSPKGPDTQATTPPTVKPAPEPPQHQQSTPLPSRQSRGASTELQNNVPGIRWEDTSRSLHEEAAMVLRDVPRQDNKPTGSWQSPGQEFDRHFDEATSGGHPKRA